MFNNQINLYLIFYFQCTFFVRYIPCLFIFKYCSISKSTFYEITHTHTHTHTHILSRRINNSLRMAKNSIVTVSMKLRVHIQSKKRKKNIRNLKYKPKVISFSSSSPHLSYAYNFRSHCRIILSYIIYEVLCLYNSLKCLKYCFVLSIYFKKLLKRYVAYPRLPLNASTL